MDNHWTDKTHVRPVTTPGIMNKAKLIPAELELGISLAKNMAYLVGQGALELQSYALNIK